MGKRIYADISKNESIFWIRISNEKNKNNHFIVLDNIEETNYDDRLLEDEFYDKLEEAYYNYILKYSYFGDENIKIYLSKNLVEYFNIYYLCKELEDCYIYNR